MALSAICALTLTPALCALFLKPQKSVVSEDASKLKNPIDKFIYKFNMWYANMLDKYTSLVGKFIKHSKAGTSGSG
jgi:HAE1 family hydrophobic/amphiphilic exporter-1